MELGWLPLVSVLSGDRHIMGRVLIYVFLHNSRVLCPITLVIRLIVCMHIALNSLLLRFLL